MGAAAPTYLPDNPLIAEFEERLQRRGLAQARCLVVTCPEEIGVFRSPHEVRVADAVCIGTPGASAESAYLVEAIEYAVQHHGVEQVVVAGHSGCEHLDEPEPPAFGVERPWIHKRLARTNRLMQAAREQVRDSVRSLQADARLRELGVPIVGVLRAIESDVYYAYYAERDAFEAML